MANKIKACTLLAFTLVLHTVTATEKSWTDGNGTTWEYYSYRDDDGNSTVTISGGGPIKGRLNIPSRIAGIKVDSIGEQAFSGRPGITEVTIPSGVEYIGRAAFEDATSLTNIIFSGTRDYYSLGYRTFAGCTALRSIDLPEGLWSLPYELFSGCHGLENVKLPSSLYRIEQLAFYDCSSLASITIPDSVKDLDSSAFEQSKLETNVAGCVYVDGWFMGIKGDCPAHLEIADTCRAIANSVLSELDGLYSLRVPETVETIGNYAFAHCYSLTNAVLECRTERLPYGLFKSCISLKSVVLPSSSRTIEGETFEDCAELTDLNIPSGIVSIDSTAFKNSGIILNAPEGSVVIKDGWAIGLNGTAPEEITIGAGCKHIADKAFSDYEANFAFGDEGCYRFDKLKKITLPSGLISIGNDAFSFCENLTEVNIPDSVTRVGHEIIRDSKLWLDQTPGIVYHDGWLIGVRNYDSWEDDESILLKIKSISIPADCRGIADCALDDCRITAITLPESVMYVGKEVFSFCYNLKSVYFRNPDISIWASALFSAGEEYSDTALSTVKMSGKWRLTGWKLPDGTVAEADGWKDLAKKSWNGEDFIIRPLYEEFDGFVPGEKVKIEYPEFIGYSASGLPSGWKWNKKTGVLTGTASKTFTVKFSKKKKETVKTTVEVGDKPVVSLATSPEGAITVKGNGAYKMNAKVKLTAAVKSGYAFAGWYVGDEMISSKASYSFKMPSEDITIEARAIHLSEDYFQITGTFQTLQLDVAEDVSSIYPVTIDSGTPYSLSVKGLPPGVSLVKETLSEPDQEQHGYAYRLKGKAKKKGVYWATFNGKNNGGYKSSCVICFLVGVDVENHKKQALLSENGDLTFIEELEFYSAQEMEDIWISTETEISGGKVYNSPKSVKVSGLPSGVKYRFDREECAVRIYGTPQKPGKYKLTFTTTSHSGAKRSSTCNMIVRDSGSVYVHTALTSNSTGMGKITGGGVKAYGAKVTLKATSSNSKKYFFAGWYGNIEETDPLYSYSQCIEPDLEHSDWRDNPRVFLADECAYPHYAMFITKAEDSISFTSDTREWNVENAGDTEPFVISGLTSVTKPTITVGKLPPGIGFTKGMLYVKTPSKLYPGTYNVAVTAKNLSKKTAKTTVSVTIPNLTDAVDQGLIDLDTSNEGYPNASLEPMHAGLKTLLTLADLGIEIADGWTLSVSGLPSGWKYSKGVISGTAKKTGKYTVTFTLSKKIKSGKKTKKLVHKATATFNVSGLPDWAVGTFSGSTLTSYDDYAGYYEPGMIKATIGATGKISGYYSVGGDKTKFSGTGFTHSGATEIAATVKGKVDGKTKSFKLTIKPTLAVDGNGTNVVVGAASFRGNIAKDENIASELLDQDLWTHPASASMLLPSLPEGESIECGSSDEYGPLEWGPGTVSLALGDRGALKIAYKTHSGTSTGSAQITHLHFDENGAWNAFVPIYIPKKKKIPELAMVVLLKLHEENGKIHSMNHDNEYLFDGEHHYIGLPTSFGYTSDIVRYRPSAY